MDEELGEAVVKELRRCAATGKPYFYWLFEKDEAGEPRLLVGKKRGPLAKEAKLVRRKAKTKRTAEGVVQKNGDTLVFVNEGSMNAKQAKKAFRLLCKDKAFKKVARLLKESEILTPDEAASQGVETPDDAQSAPDDSELLKRIRKKVRQIVRAFEGTDGADTVTILDEKIDLAQRRLKRGDTDRANTLLEKIDTRSDELAAEAWAQVSEPVIARGTEAGLSDPVSRAVGLGASKRWREAVAALEAIEDNLDRLARGEPEETSDTSGDSETVDDSTSDDAPDEEWVIEDEEEEAPPPRNDSPALTRLADLVAELQRAELAAHARLKTYLTTVEADPDVPPDVWASVRGPLTDVLEGLVPSMSAVLEACTDVTDALPEERMDRAKRLAEASSTVLVRAHAARKAAALHASAFGAFDVFPPITDALERIGMAAAVLRS